MLSCPEEFLVLLSTSLFVADGSLVNVWPPAVTNVGSLLSQMVEPTLSVYPPSANTVNFMSLLKRADRRAARNSGSKR